MLLKRDRRNEQVMRTVTIFFDKTRSSVFQSLTFHSMSRIRSKYNIFYANFHNTDIISAFLFRRIQSNGFTFLHTLEISPKKFGLIATIAINRKRSPHTNEGENCERTDAISLTRQCLRFRPNTYISQLNLGCQ